MSVTIKDVERYIELGVVVHPTCPVDHKCTSPGKIPFDPVEGKHMNNWQNHTQFSGDAWGVWLDYDSSINIGGLCGSPSGLIFIDIDNDDALRKYNELQRNDGRGSTWKFVTGNGVRYIFRDTKGSCSSFKLAAGNGKYLEVLGNGKQSVLPNSDHISGRRYKWDDLYSPKHGGPLDAPSWCYEGAGREDEERANGGTDWKNLIRGGLHSGERNETLAMLAGHLLAPQPLPPAEVRLWMELYNKHMCKPPLPPEELKKIIRSISGREEASEGIIQNIMKVMEIRDRDLALEYFTQNPDLWLNDE